MIYHFRTILRFLSLLFLLLLLTLLVYLLGILLISFLHHYFSYRPNSMTYFSMFMMIFSIYIGIMVVYPMVHVIRWLIQLSKGVYEEPPLRKGLLSKFRKNQPKRHFLFFFFGDLFDHMEQLTERLRTSEEERKRLEKQRRDWIAGISHDLKTPLAYIKGYASMMSVSRYNWTETDIQQFSRQIEEKTEEVEQWMKDLNLFVLADQQQLPLQRERISLTPFIKEIVLDLANSPLAEGRHFSFASDAPSLSLVADPRYLKRSVQNLVMNGVLHNPEGTSIHIQVEQKENQACIQVRDDGVGMDRNTLDTYDPQTWCSTLRPSSAGTGLGMIIAKQLIAAHQGKMEVQSEKGEGTTIHVFLPLSV
ncbi:sensor histidine kinase [Kroppenstedtia eburnea]|uniref:histidine kinase n=1 Tax=Kroppenstedtia eburnea TaxID=714067 RepID=A0A1N7MJE6_9BACL|nr:HAMP domain-containing sensor histidine kinase [Kroppenstedtia eburnea]EGK07134.1 hypothetical protein HMPREF9374_3895 [Desmospora sp. 8437]QKI81605.1 HAMP domain-containing histidine kinase [Kroppenstedtia eburnea]SIS86118.1 Signal transduction histidine kinase [Kroppenstedtia eburnea]